MEINDKAFENHSDEIFMDMIEVENVSSEMLCNSLGCA
jgi:hypothetical protein